MTREDLKDIVRQIVEKLEEQAPKPACLWWDHPCDVTTKYAIGEEG